MRRCTLIEGGNLACMGSRSGITRNVARSDFTVDYPMVNSLHTRYNFTFQIRGNILQYWTDTIRSWKPVDPLKPISTRGKAFQEVLHERLVGILLEAVKDE